MVHGLVCGKNDDVIYLVSRVICNNGSSEQKKRNDFTLSFSFQINISVKITAGLLRTLKTSTKSSPAIDRVVWKRCSVNECGGFRWNFRLFRAARHFPVTAAPVSRPSRSGIQLKTEHAQQSFTVPASRGQRLSAFIRTLSRGPR